MYKVLLYYKATHHNTYLNLILLSGKYNSGKAVAKNQTLSRLALPDDLEAPAYLPDKSDMFLSFATVPGYMYVCQQGVTSFSSIYFIAA